MTLAVLLDTAADLLSERPVLGRRPGLPVSGLRRRAIAAAGWLRERDARCCVFLGLNGPAVPIGVFGAAYAGIPFAPLNYRLADDRLAAVLDRLDGAVVVADDEQCDRLRAIGVDPVPTGHWLDTLADTEPVTPQRQPADDDVAVLLFTSGTTAEPKAVPLRHRHLTSYVLNTVDLGGAGEDEATLVSVPPYHVAAIGSAITNVLSGRRLVHLPRFDPADWLDTVRLEGITTAMVVPTMLARLVSHLDGSPARLPLRALAYGGARMPPAVLERALRVFPDVEFTNAYGLTETSSTIAVLTPADHRAALVSDDPTVRARLSSVGRAVPGIELRVHDADPDGYGELLVRGEQVSGEYVGTGSVLDADGWFPTRDEARVDDDGYLFVRGRADDTVIRGGENIAPAEVEDVLTAHPLVADAGVVGLPDQEWGERLAAAVVCPNGTVQPAELREWVRARLRSSRTPDVIVTVDELPYNATGKLLRRELRQRLIEGGS